MKEIKCECVGLLSGDKWDKMHDISRRVYDTNGLSPTIHTMGGGNLEPKIIDPQGRVKKKCKPQSICPTLRAQIHGNPPQVIEADGYMLNQSKSFNAGALKDCARTLQSENPNGAVIINNCKIRKLTPKECWRLMGFSDYDFDKAKAAGVSNSQLYKQSGNSIVVNVLEAIFKQMI